MSTEYVLCDNRHVLHTGAWEELKVLSPSPNPSASTWTPMLHYTNCCWRSGKNTSEQLRHKVSHRTRELIFGVEQCLHSGEECLH